MKKTEKDYEYLETSDELKARGLRRITRPKFLDKIPKNVSLRDCKSRVTIDLDADIVEFFKTESQNTDEGYQILINRALRQVVDNAEQRKTVVEIKESLLADEDFLERLKSKLAA